LVELIPGTSLPMYGPQNALQPEGRGDVKITGDRMPVSMLEQVDGAPGLSQRELEVLAAALRVYDAKPARMRVEYPRSGAVTDATTGNVIVQLFEVPQGMQGHLAQVTVDIPGSGSINPTAPFASGSAFSFLAKAPSASGNRVSPSAANVTAFRAGMISFAPTSAAGPMIPGQWTFNDSNAPVAFGGEAFFYVLSGGSVAAVVAQSLSIVARINLENKE
jgi:hypothetical protein